MRALAWTLALSLYSTACVANDFTVEFRAPHGRGDLRECQLEFDAAVPPKTKVDQMMAAALQLCIARDDAHDIQTMALSQDELLHDGQASYAWLEYDHKTKQIKRTTFADQWKGIVPIDR